MANLAREEKLAVLGMATRLLIAAIETDNRRLAPSIQKEPGIDPYETLADIYERMLGFWAIKAEH